MEWREGANCRTGNGNLTDLFFPPGEVNPAAVKQADDAKAVCADCPVREQCLDFAITTLQSYGVWGGMTPRERVRYRQSQREQRMTV